MAFLLKPESATSLVGVLAGIAIRTGPPCNDSACGGNHDLRNPLWPEPWKALSSQHKHVTDKESGKRDDHSKVPLLLLL